MKKETYKEYNINIGSRKIIKKLIHIGSRKMIKTVDFIFILFLLFITDSYTTLNFSPHIYIYND